MTDRLRRREFIVLVAAAPALACRQDVSPASPTQVIQTPSPEPPRSQPPAVAAPIPPGSAPAIALSEVSARVEGNELVVAIAGTPLQTLGGMARSEGAVLGLHRYVLLVRTAPDRVHAMNGICTHEGCIINRMAAPAFECPCHGSQYDHGGTVLRGPAPAALPALTTTFDGVTVRIRV